ncbi:Nitrogen permease reactivator protein [Zalaria obscura]|uniref:Nitrogen permease reactivator protein n=1 Tax=Zalaria obscura TaxID=2024903 RepID=A0ACC3SLW3_9PEZI
MTSSTQGPGGPHAVRFSTENQEISPETTLDPVENISEEDDERDNLNPESEEQLRELKSTLQNTVQSRRMEQYQFEPVSLPPSQPVSRVSNFGIP